jgi:hypothetical protein
MKVSYEGGATAEVLVVAARATMPERASIVVLKTSERRSDLYMIVVLLGAGACGGRRGRAISGTEGELTDHRKEALNDGFFRQANVGVLVGRRAAEGRREEDDGGGGAGPLEVRYQVALLLALEALVDDNDVGGQVRRAYS